MTISSPSRTPPAAATEPAAPRPPSRRAVLWSRLQFLVALVATAAFLAYLLLVTPTGDGGARPGRPPEEAAPVASVAVVGPGLIRVRPDTPFAGKLTFATARRESITQPLLLVAGRVVASLRPGASGGDPFWQFDSLDTMESYTTWERATTDIAFREGTLERQRKLNEARLAAQREIVARLEKLVKIGTDTVGDLNQQKAELLQLELGGLQEIHQAETELRMASREAAAEARKLQQEGLDPAELARFGADIDIVMAEVPEGRSRYVAVGQACEARFAGLPKDPFTGRVHAIAPVLSPERRSLRVMFAIDDPDDKLRPGMFAEIGLGTDPREALLVPADAVLHVGYADYVLVADRPDSVAGDGTWRVTEVEVGELRESEVEILGGLSAGERIIGKGAILFKPLVPEAVRTRERR
jgi:cobalt-zinc-cadmium efflux system membrane fusion protein